MASATASSKVRSRAAASHSSSTACSASPVFGLSPDCAAIMRAFRGGSVGFVLPRMKGWSRGSMVLVIRVAASASVRAMATRSTP